MFPDTKPSVTPSMFLLAPLVFKGEEDSDLVNITILILTFLQGFPVSMLIDLHCL